MKSKMGSWINTIGLDANGERSFETLAIGDQLARLRIRSGLTQAELGKRIGTTASAISRYESTRYDRYELKTLKKIAAACGGSLQLSIQGPVLEQSTREDVA
jgi:transcriptional regulator with XRE-family HTH domain